MILKETIRVHSKVLYHISCNAIQDPLMPIVIEKAYLRFSKSQFDIMENYKLYITKGFASLIGAKTRLHPFKILRDTGASQTVKVKCKAHNVFQLYTFLDSDFNTLI